jgi:hypothetical protein
MAEGGSSIDSQSRCGTDERARKREGARARRADGH